MQATARMASVVSSTLPARRRLIRVVLLQPQPPPNHKSAMSNDPKQAFKFSRDWRKIMWGATLWHNLLRAACAGLVWSIVSIVNGSGIFGKMPPFSEVIVLPIVYVVGILPMAIVFGFLGQFFWPLGIMALMLSISVIVGDPIVWLLSKFVPNSVPTKSPGFLNFVPVMWILKELPVPSAEEEHPPPLIEKQSGGSGFFATKCKHCGSVDHSSANCPHGLLSSKCTHCGSTEHASGDCPHGILSDECKHCGSKDHASDKCPHGLFSTKCTHCGSTEHASGECPHGLFSTKCTHCGSTTHPSDKCPH